MTEALANSKSKPRSGRKQRDRPAVRSRTERRPHSLDQTRWLRPQDHRHRIATSPTTTISWMSTPCGHRVLGPTWVSLTSTTAR